MKSMRLSDVNRFVANRTCQGMPHNTGIKTKQTLERIGEELKNNPPKILAKTKRKFGAKRAAKQKTAILLEKARKAGAQIPRKS